MFKKSIITFILIIGIISIIYYSNLPLQESFSNQEYASIADEEAKSLIPIKKMPYNPKNYTVKPDDTSDLQDKNSLNQNRSILERSSPGSTPGLVPESAPFGNSPDCPPFPPKYIYASQYDNLVSSGDPRVIFSGLKSEVLDATYIPRVISKDVFPYIPSNRIISLTNKGDMPWNRHPINSLQRNLKPKYDNVFYYELDNDLYINAFNKTFQNSCNFDDRFSNDKWSDIYEAYTSTPYILDSYNALIQYIEMMINNSEYLVLKETTKTFKKIQIVHDIFINYRRHLIEPYTCLLHIEVLLYREGKYNGKHIGIKCAISNNNLYPIEDNSHTSAPGGSSAPSGNPSSSPAPSGNPSSSPAPSGNPSSSPAPSKNNLIEHFINSPAPSIRSPSPAPSRRGPSPAPSIRSPSPAPSRRGPSPAPSRRGSSPAPSRRGPSPAPSRRGPSPAPGSSILDTWRFGSKLMQSPSIGPSQSGQTTNSILVNSDNPDVPPVTFYIIESELIGDVPDDMIALYPFVANDKNNIEQLNISADVPQPNYAGILPPTANGKIYSGFADNDSEATAASIKNHLQNYIDLSKKTTDYITQIKNMLPEQAVIVLSQVSSDIRKSVLSTISSDIAAKILLLMDSDTQKQVIFEMDSTAAKNALYLMINNK
jgi:hypothetical protein